MDFREVVQRRALVRALLTALDRVGPLGARAILLVTVGTWGCLWSPDIREKPQSRFPPTVDRAWVTPAPDQAVVMTNAPVEFSVEGAVTDLDDDVETLTYAWFLNWPQNCEPGQCYGPFYFPGRGANKKLTVNPCGLFRKYLEADEYHLLELIVTDGEVTIDVSRGRIVTGGHAYVAWWLENRLSCP